MQQQQQQMEQQQQQAQAQLQQQAQLAQEKQAHDDYQRELEDLLGLGYDDLEEEIYMEPPEGMDLNGKTECLSLVKSIYGLVQASRMYYLFFTKLLRKIGFVGGYADPCLMMRKDENGIVYIAIWVDDSLLIGHDAAIEQTIKDLQANGFGLKIEGELDDYLSCEISFSQDKSKGWIHQPHFHNSHPRLNVCDISTIRIHD
jgi:hypothetical protein